MVSLIEIQEDASHIGGMLARLDKLVRRLEKFSRSEVLAALGGLLTVRQFHPSTIRIEALAHLAAAVCNGDVAPSSAHIRDWLNNIMLPDRTGRIEDPVEDVFVSNVVYWGGNARIFEGVWNANDGYLQNALLVLSHLKEDGWAKKCRRPIRALLILSDIIASRANLFRYATSDGSPQQHIKLSSSDLAEVAGRVTFGFDELEKLNISPNDIDPFLFSIRVDVLQEKLSGEVVGHSSLERYPFFLEDDKLICSLPTAISPAIRRFILEEAVSAGREKDFLHRLTKVQFEQILRFGIRGWKIDLKEKPKVDLDRGVVEITGTFDEGAYLYLIFIQDKSREILEDGFRGAQDLTEYSKTVEEKEKVLCAQPGYQRGITIVIHGGLGRGFLIGFDGDPLHWRRLALTCNDFSLMGWDSEFSALRVWKILTYQQEAEDKGVRILNLSGFINLYAFCEQRDFVFWPDELPLGPNSLLTIESNVVVSLRKRLREALDYHAGLYPGLKAWLPLHRQHANAFFKQLRAQPIYLSVEHLDSRMLLGCVEGRNTFWVWYDRDAIKSEKNIVAGQMWNMVLNLIFKMISEFDDLLSTEKQSVVFEIQFPGLNDLEKGFLKNIPVLAGPDVTAVDNRIIISCSNEYIRNFGLSDNVGDRLMVEALMNGISKITGNILSGERSAPILDKLASDRYARSFHILPADSGKDRILATVPFSSPRFVQLEDYSWIQVGMRELLEINLPSNQVISEGALEICDKMVELLWRKIKKSLIGLDRKSLLLKCLQKHDAIEADRARWSITSAALKALYSDYEELTGVANFRESERARAALSIRILIEMAICTSPLEGGVTCPDAEYDSLIAHISLLLWTANHRDTIYYGFCEGLSFVESGRLDFDAAFSKKLKKTYLTQHGVRRFEKAAMDYESLFEPRTDKVDSPPNIENFKSVFIKEYGIDFTNLIQFCYDLADLAVEKGSSVIEISRDRLIEMLVKVEGFGVEKARYTLDRFSLYPRQKWDEPSPHNAKKSDWYPWRYGRRLSLTMRPLVRYDGENFLVSPVFFENALRHLSGIHDGRLPADLFDTKEMREFVGSQVNFYGHEFNRIVAEEVRKISAISVDCEVSMTRLGGKKEQGDVDVLAWNSKTGVVYIIECKRLNFSRTLSEVSERLKEYAPERTADGERRNPMHKHLDRIDFLKKNISHLCAHTGITREKITLKSCLITDDLVPMQFSDAVNKAIDIVLDISQVELRLV